jgi:hypothetical protein
MACCRCCEKTGACCTDEGCTQETCADCEDAGGLFQGVDTECVDGDCPCDPPADPGKCEKCVDGEVVSRCPDDAPNCCDGVCQAEECAGCETDEDCDEGQNCCNGQCTPATCCNAFSDCPTYGLPCEDVFPGSPELCCDGACEPHACHPGAQITLSFIRKVGCLAPFLSHIAEGDPFDVVISGGALAECGVTSIAITSAPCLTAWTLGADCEVADLTFDPAGLAFCADCYEFVGWTSCRLDCNGDCA